MKSVLILFFALVLSQFSRAHEYYFGFAELSYNQQEQEFEGTIVLSYHDINEWLEMHDVISIELIELKNDTEALKLISSEILSGFQLSTNGQLLSLQIIGFEVLANGNAEFYFHSTPLKKPFKLDIKFDLLMDWFPKQQNKITYKDNRISVTEVFMPSKQTTSISLK